MIENIFSAHTATMALAAVGCVTAACAIDLASALITARQLGEKVRSARLRHTIEKLTRYLLPLSLMALLDLLLGMTGLTDTPWCMLAVALAEVGVETRSVMEHAQRRRDKTAKLPEELSSLAAWLGNERMETLINTLFKIANDNKHYENDTNQKDRLDSGALHSGKPAQYGCRRGGISHACTRVEAPRLPLFD